jgi:hypothetical protein
MLSKTIYLNFRLPYLSPGVDPFPTIGLHLNPLESMIITEGKLIAILDDLKAKLSLMILMIRHTIVIDNLRFSIT